MPLKDRVEQVLAAAGLNPSTPGSGGCDGYTVEDRGGSVVVRFGPALMAGALNADVKGQPLLVSEEVDEAVRVLSEAGLWAERQEARGGPYIRVSERSGAKKGGLS